MRFRVLSAWMLTILFVTLVLTFTVQVSHAQDVFGTIVGTVTDSSGGLVPKAQVTITNERTGIARSVVANDSGYYVASQLEAGVYTVAVSAKGFKIVTKTGNDLHAGDHLTVDAVLQVGAATETVEVTAVGQTINTSSAEISRTVDTAQVQNLALNQRNFTQLVTLVPGAALMVNGTSGNGFDYTSSTTGMGLEVASMHGLRPDANFTALDGASNTDSGSNATMINNVGIDFIQEVTVQTSNYSVEYSRGSATNTNVVTQGGGDKFHGDVFEYFENNYLNAALDSNKWQTPLGPNNTYTAAQQRQIKPELRYNDFGGKFGGPLIRGKLYFMYGEEAKRLVLDPDPSSDNGNTMPTTSELTGNFADADPTSNANPALVARGAVPASCIGMYSGTTFMPSTGAGYAALVSGAGYTWAGGPGYGNAIAPSCITGAGQAISKVYSVMEKVPFVGFTNSVASNNAQFSPFGPQDIREDFVRIDYNPTAHHSTYFRYVHDKIQLIDPFGTFYLGGLPNVSTLRSRPGWNYQLADIWQISPTLINEAKMNITWNSQHITPSGNTWQASTFGLTPANYAEPFGNAVGTWPTGLPVITFSGCPATSTNPIYCPSEIDGPAFLLFSPITDISPMDNITWTHKDHTLKWGISFLRNRKDQNGRPTSYNGAPNFSGAGCNQVEGTTNACTNANSTGDAFADALLGNYNTYSQYSADPVGHFRFNDWGTYLEDNWRVTRKVTLDLGIRADYTVPTYTEGNNMTNFIPSLYAAEQAANPIRVGGGSAGGLTNVPYETTTGLLLDCPTTIYQAGGPCSSGGFDVYGLEVAGGVPAAQDVRVPGATSPFVLDIPAVGDRGLYKTELVWSPRVGVAFSPDTKTSVRLGLGMFYDKPEGNIIFSQVAQVPFLQQVTYNAGNLAVLPASGNSPTIISGISALNPDLRVARDMQWSLSVQRELPWGLFAQAAYVGNHGWHLLRQPNINVPTFAAAAADSAAAVLSETTITGNQERPYLGYGDITQYNSDGYSNFDDLELSAAKRKGWATFSVAYTFEKTLATGSGEGDNPEPACAFVCTLASGTNVPWQQYWYGPVSFDIKNIFVTSFTFDEPWFKNLHGFKGEVLGGWLLSGMVRAQSGSPLTATAGSQSIGPSAGVSSGLSYSERANINPGVPLYLTGSAVNCAASHICFFNPAAFSLQPNSAVGTAPVGDLIGPGYYAWDLSLRKNIGLATESMRLMLELDAFNVWNRVNYTSPGTSCGSASACGSSFGQISSTYPPRQVQLAVKFSF